MGDTIWIQVKQGKRVTGGKRDNSIMLKLEKNLQALSRKLKVKKLRDFYDYSVLAATYGDEFGLPEEEIKETWSESSEGLRSLQAIYSHLLEHPEDLKFKPDSSREHWPKMLMDELKHCVSVVKKAAAAGHAFRLAIVP